VKRVLLTLLVALTAASPALADQALADKKKCMACHTLSKKVVGPAYKDVAAKYAGKNVSAWLASKIISGGGGVWGVLPMPANPKVSQAEANELASWILSLK
jgi:cytochrome c